MFVSLFFAIFTPVNKQVDITRYIEEFRSEISKLNHTVTELAEENSRLHRRIDALNVENTNLRHRLSKYEDVNPPKNSTNSSIPPSKENMTSEIIRRTKSLRVKSGKKSGGQDGHEGITRLMADIPDAIENHQPNYCKECGKDLSGIEGTEIYREDSIGFRIVPIVARHRYLDKVCTCGCHNHADVVKRKNPVYFGQEVRALVVYLNVVMCMPYNRIKNFISDVMGIDISEGSIRNFIETAGAKAEEICGRISNALTSSPVAGADESGIYVNGKLKWAWILQTPKLTLTWLAKERGAKEMTDKLGDDALKDTVLTTDRHGAYFSMNVAGHQICIAHLLRNLNYLNELDKTQKWSPRLQELLRKAVHWRNENPGIATDIKEWLGSLDALLNENLDKLKKEFRQIRNSLKKYRDHIFRFLQNPKVPSHNNASEGGIRILKVKQKRSGGFRSNQGADDFMAIHSVIDTAKKNNYSTWNAVIALV